MDNPLPQKQILVCGSRAYIDDEKIHSVLNEYDIMELVTGDSSGADRLATNYAKGRGIPLVVLCAEWNRYGRAAGPIRTKKLLDYVSPDVLVIAFDMSGPGTRRTVQDALKRGYEVRIE